MLTTQQHRPAAVRHVEPPYPVRIGGSTCLRASHEEEAIGVCERTGADGESPPAPVTEDPTSHHWDDPRRERSSYDLDPELEFE